MPEYSKQKIERVICDLKKKGYSILKSKKCENLANKALLEYKSIMQTHDLNAQKALFSLNELQTGAWRKTAIGSQNGLGDPISQVLQSTYVSETSPSFSAIRQCAKELIMLRNRLSNLPDDFGSSPERDHYWNAVRIHHYPCGGGHMQKHRDTHFSEKIKNHTNTFIQVAMNLSIKGRDFNAGGLYVYDRSDKAVCLEDHQACGNIVVFDGRLEHEVKDVDLDQVLNWQSPKGRVALYSNLYSYSN